MNKKMRLKVATRIKRARLLMNDEGKHWIQGAFLVFDEDDEPTFCLVGGLRGAGMPKRVVQQTAELGADLQHDEVYKHAVIEVARELGFDGDPAFDGDEIDPLAEAYWSAEDELIAINDDEFTTWKEIEAALLKAEERMRA